MTMADRRAAEVDMSPAAIDRRLRQVEELRRLCLSLGRARPLGPVHRPDGLLPQAGKAPTSH